MKTYVNCPAPKTEHEAPTWAMLNQLHIHTHTREQAWLQYEQARHLSTFHDLHAVMAFAAMANGVDDDEEAELWRSRTQDLLRSMREYVRSGGVTTSQQTVAAAAETTAARAQAPPLPPPAVVQLHSFPNGPNRGSVFSSAGGFEDEGPDGEAKGPSPPDNLWVAEHIGVALCEAMVAYRGVSLCFVLLFFFIKVRRLV